jgi:hypothetical protein
MTGLTLHRSRPQRKGRRLDPLSVVLLVVASVAFVLVIVGIVGFRTSPLWLLPPIALALWNLLTLRK